MVTKTFKLTYMAQIVFLLDHATRPFLLENAKLEHGLGNPRYVHLGNCAIFMFSLRTMYISTSQTLGMDENNTQTRMRKLAHPAIGNSKGTTDGFPLLSIIRDIYARTEWFHFAFPSMALRKYS